MTSFNRLMHWAVRRHGLQLYGGEPYSVHLIELLIVAEEFFPSDARLRQGILGHDLGEDRGATAHELKAAGFSRGARSDILAVTDVPAPNRAARKKATLPRIAAGGTPAVKLKLVDRVANVRRGLLEGNLRKLKMYVREQPELEAALYDPAHTELAPIWLHLQNLIAAAAKQEEALAQRVGGETKK